MSSREYIGKRVVIWPVNIDCALTKKGGRRLSLKDCVSKPKIEEIIKACENINLDPIFEEKAYPRAWYLERGRIVVLKKFSKSKLLKLIADEIKKMRTKPSG